MTNESVKKIGFAIMKKKTELNVTSFVKIKCLRKLKVLNVQNVLGKTVNQSKRRASFCALKIASLCVINPKL